MLGNCFPSSDFLELHGPGKVGVQYTKSAEQGDASAQYNLGVMYDNGEGVPKNPVQAYAWYDIAQANGHEKAKESRNELERTPEELIEAKKLAKEILKRIEADK